MNREWEKDPEFLDIDPETIGEYRDMMEKGFNLLMENKSYFLRENAFPVFLKIQKVDEMMDFFIVEEDFEKCQELQKVKDSLEIKLIIGM